MEAAGGGGLQLFVDSNVSVDSALIRQLVDEVLTEHIRLMLGHRDTQEPDPGPEPPRPGPGARQEVQRVRTNLKSLILLPSVCLNSAAGPVSGETGSTGSNTSANPSPQPDLPPQRDPTSDYTPSL